MIIIITLTNHNNTTRHYLEFNEDRTRKHKAEPAINQTYTHITTNQPTNTQTIDQRLTQIDKTHAHTHIYKPQPGSKCLELH